MKEALYVLAVVAFVVFVACQRANVEIGPAPIHEVKVTTTTLQPPQVIVYIKGGLRDTCTTFYDLKVKRSGSVIDITVTVQTKKDVACAQVYTFFEKNVNLGSDFVSGQTYTINVNDTTTGFVMP